MTSVYPVKYRVEDAQWIFWELQHGSTTGHQWPWRRPRAQRDVPGRGSLRWPWRASAGGIGSQSRGSDGHWTVKAQPVVRVCVTSVVYIICIHIVYHNSTNVAFSCFFWCDTLPYVCKQFVFKCSGRLACDRQQSAVRKLEEVVVSIVQKNRSVSSTEGAQMQNVRCVWWLGQQSLPAEWGFVGALGLHHLRIFKEPKKLDFRDSWHSFDHQCTFHFGCVKTKLHKLWCCVQVCFHHKQFNCWCLWLLFSG